METMNACPPEQSSGGENDTLVRQQMRLHNMFIVAR